MQLSLEDLQFVQKTCAEVMISYAEGTYSDDKWTSEEWSKYLKIGTYLAQVHKWDHFYAFMTNANPYMLAWLEGPWEEGDDQAYGVHFDLFSSPDWV